MLWKHWNQKQLMIIFAQFRLATQKILQQLRESIQQAATNAKEVNKEINKTPSNDLLAN